MTATDDVAGFDSGEPTLDTWLKERALANQTSNASRTYVTTNYEGEVAGFYSLATASVQNRAAPGRVRRNQPDPIPVILLARLAVNQKEQRQRLGQSLLRDTIARSVQAADLVGVRALLAHALHEEAKRFYLHFGFLPSPTDELHLFLLIKTARAAMESS